MKAEQLFIVVNIISILGWLLISILPQWKYTRIVVLSGAIPILLAVGYTILIAIFFGSGEGGFDSLANVMKLFTNEWSVLAGWIHFLAFDLFVGSWEVMDSQKKGVSHVLVIPCLFLTFMFGPMGLLAYVIVRHFAAKGVQHEDELAA